MLTQLFQRPYALRRQLNAPLLEERLRYLAYRAEQETPRTMLYEISFYQLIIIKYLHLKNDKQIIALRKLETAANRWAHHQMQHFKRSKSISYSTCKVRFMSHAKHWLRFLGRLEIPRKPPIPSQVAEFVNYMRNERGLSEATICVSRYLLQKFFSQIKDTGQFLANLTPAQLDAIQIKKLRKGVYSRHTIYNDATTLRAFLHYAERQGWCRLGIANSIKTPRIYKHEVLPSGPTWEDVQHLLKTAEGNRPWDIRARAVILLLAVYGLRKSEVCRLRLEDFDWEHETFRIQRSKLGPIQQFPLVQTVKQALLRYIKEVRPQHSTYREIFLTIHAPFHPISGSLYEIVSLRWKPLDVSIKHYGPHSLRHACATRLINQGMPLKTIADHLGHRNLDATRIYAKVDLPRLREVANFNLRGVL